VVSIEDEENCAQLGLNNKETQPVGFVGVIGLLSSILVVLEETQND
jgi:hypothetical protein